MSKTKDTATMRGFFHIQVNDGYDIVGDSGWRENQITNLGVNQFLVNWLGGDTANGKSITHLALGTGTAPASNATSLAGEITHASNSRQSVSTSVVSARTLQLTAAFNSADSWLTAAANISNLGLFNVSTTNVGTIFAGNTYASSSIATNQNVQATYQIRFS